MINQIALVEPLREKMENQLIASREFAEDALAQARIIGLFIELERFEKPTQSR